MALFGGGKKHPDLAATPRDQNDAPAGSAPSPSLQIPIEGIPLSDFTSSNRRHLLDRYEAYFRGCQDDGKMYDWNGAIMGFEAAGDIAPGWDVPYKKRKPCARYDVGRIIIERITSLLFGVEHFPEILVPGDPDAEDYVRELARQAKLPTRMIESRDLGGAVGAVGYSFGFVRGKPRVEVHNAKHLEVLRWADEHERTIGAVLKTYAYERRIYDPGAGKLKDAVYYYARYWDENIEIVWEPIPEAVAKTPNWRYWPSKTITHNYGFTPCYWVQNVPDSTEPEGYSDIDGVCDNLDEINQLMSSGSTAVKANNDPTLVIKMDPGQNPGNVRKGQGHALFSSGGADYLTLGADAIAACEQMLDRLKQATLDTAGVVLLDPKDHAGTAASGSAIRLRFAPMLATCDIRREQYGSGAIVPLLTGMLRAAKIIGSRPGREIRNEQGEVAELRRDAVILPPRVVPNDDGTVRVTERNPGVLEDIELKWNPYFPPSWEEISQAVTATTAANGNKPLISQRTATASVQSLFGVVNVDQEVEAMKGEAEEALEQAQRAMSVGAPPERFTAEEPKEKDDESEA